MEHVDVTFGTFIDAIIYGGAIGVGAIYPLSGAFFGWGWVLIFYYSPVIVLSYIVFLLIACALFVVLSQRQVRPKFLLIFIALSTIFFAAHFAVLGTDVVSASNAFRDFFSINVVVFLSVCYMSRLLFNRFRRM